MKAYSKDELTEAHLQAIKETQAERIKCSATGKGGWEEFLLSDEGTAAAFLELAIEKLKLV